MTATDKLRHMLDERGVEWDANDTYRLLVTSWKDASGHNWAFMEHRDGSFSKLTAYHLTPEQAVELGRGTCHADETDTLDCVCDSIGRYGQRVTVHVMECSACGGTYEHVNGSYEFCPRCGARVVEVDE